MKLSRKKRRQLKQQLNSGKELHTTEKPKQKKKRKEHICFHYTPPVYGGRKDIPLLLIETPIARPLLPPVEARPAKSCVEQDSDGNYVCKVCGTKFSREQVQKIEKVVELLNEGKPDEKTLAAQYEGIFPVKFYRTTQGVLKTEEMTEQELKHENIRL